MPGKNTFSQLVVVGASAGGIEALSTLVASLPPVFPAPLVIAQHLDPQRPSHLGEILARHSTLPVRTLTEHEDLAPGVVFVVPANRYVAVTDHAVDLREEGVGRSKPSVDLLLSSAAAVFGDRLIAVILTGTGSDGAGGARQVKAAGGTVLIQNPATAKYPAMPAALDPTVVDIVAELGQLGPLLLQLLTEAHLPDSARDMRALRAFLVEVQRHTGIDFSRYKLPTIRRRLQRRMAALETASLGDYRAYIQKHTEEYARLASSFLIKVTEFFRDAPLFDYLRETVLPELIARARAHADKELRIWSAGCATGEEAYTLAILLAEALGPDLDLFEVRIYATDLDAQSIATARRGVYPAAALAAIPAPLVDRYFTRHGESYEIKKWVRGLTVFGEHDLGQRPPFPRIDLCLCRNVLIYFTPELQTRALQLFAFALRDGGYLALGASESVRPLAAYFAPVEPRLKVYRRQGERMLIPSARLLAAPTLPLEHAAPARRNGDGRARRPARPRAAAAQDGLVQGLLGLPVGVVVVDRRYDIQVLNSAARRLLGVHGTAIGDDLIHLVQGIPASTLRAAIDAAFAPDAPGSADPGRARVDVVLPVETAAGEQLSVQLACYPHTTASRGAGDPAHRGDDTVLIVAIDVTQTELERQAREAQDARALREREQALETLRGELAAVAAQQEEEITRLTTQHQAEAGRLTAQREEETTRLTAQVQRLTAANRGLLAANEELAATNLAQRGALDEMQTTAMEAQAATEEAEILNEEMQATNEELETLNEEMQATVEELQTANADLRARGEELEEQAAALEEQRRQSEAERRRLGEILQQAPSMMAVLHGPEHRFTFANGRYLSGAGRSEEAVIGRTVLEVFPELQHTGQGLHLILDQVYATGTPYAVSEQPMLWNRNDDGRLEEMIVDLVVQPLYSGTGAVEGILIHGLDVSSRLQARREGVESARLAELDRLRTEFVSAVSHRLQTPLTAVRAALGLLEVGARERLATEERELLEAACQNVERLRIHIADLLAANQIEAGTLQIVGSPLDLRSVIARAVEAIHPMLQEKEQTLEMDLPEPLPTLGDPRWLEQAVIDLLANAHRHTPTGTRVTIAGRRRDDGVLLVVRDTGPGIPATEVEAIFARFHRAGAEAGGSGLGLAIVREIVGLHGGRVWAESPPGEGAAFHVALPGTGAGGTGP